MYPIEKRIIIIIIITIIIIMIIIIRMIIIIVITELYRKLLNLTILRMKIKQLIIFTILN